MKIGIDISQLSYPGTGVANFLEDLLKSLLKTDTENEYVLFFSSLRAKPDLSFLDEIQNSLVKIRKYLLPPTMLDILWNRLHIFPIEWFVGNVDVFISSDWTEPPAKKAKKATILYDLIVYKHPRETDEKIVAVQKRKLKWVKKETEIVFCISNATKKDAQEILGIELNKLKVIYPGI